MLFRHSSLAIGLLAIAAPLAAQQRDSARARLDSADVFLLPAVVVSAAHAPIRPERIGFAMSAIMPAELRLRRPATAADALRDVAGAFVEEAAGPGGPTIVRLRGGEEVFTQILLDGVAINENGGFFDFQGFAPSNVERIEVARGPQSALHGSSAVSGVISFITPRGEAGPLIGSFYGEGSDASSDGGGWRATGQLSGGTERIAFSAGAGLSYARGIQALPHDTRSSDASVRIDARPASGVDVTLTSRLLGMEGNLPVRDPGATRVPLDPNARNERDRFVSALTGRWTAPSGNLSQHLRAQHYQEDFIFEDERDDVLLEVVDAPFFIFDADFLLDSRRDRTTLEYGGRFVPAPLANFSYGVQWSREVVKDRTDGEFGAGRQSLDRNSRAAFAELLISPLARLDVLAGIRVEKFEEMDAAWTPRASAVVHVVPDRLSLRAAAGRAFKAPNLQQQYLDNPFIRSNPDLTAETSTSWEVGADVRAADGRAALALTYFSQRFDNLIRTVALEGSSTGQQINRNLGESSARGIEWDGRWRFAQSWTAGARGSWVETEIEENVGLNAAEYPLGGRLPFRPVHVHSVYLEHRVGTVFDARVGATHVGSQMVLAERFSGPREELDGYVSANVALRLRLRERIALHARADNLFNAEYQTAFDRGGAPLNVALGLRVGHD